MKLERIDVNVFYSNEFVAAAVQIDETGHAYHAGIFIYENETHYLFHYTGYSVELVSEIGDDWYIFKVFDFIAINEIASFLAHSKIIADKASPRYGFCYSGSYYDEHGIYQTTTTLPELMTCVGFCLNVLKGFIEEDEYIQYGDWEADTIPYSATLTIQINRLRDTLTEEQVADFNNNLRRIDPTDYLCSAYYSTLPVTKVQVDAIKEQIVIELTAFKEAV